MTEQTSRECQGGVDMQSTCLMPTATDLGMEVSMLRQQVAALKKSQEELREDLSVERSARIFLEERLKSVSNVPNNTACEAAHGLPCGHLPTPESPQRLAPVPGTHASPQNAVRDLPKDMRVSDMMAPSPRTLQMRRIAVGAQVGGQCSSSTYPVHQMHTANASAGYGDDPQVTGALPGSQQRGVSVQISKKLFSVEARWQRICSETAVLRSLLEPQCQGTQPATANDSFESWNSMSTTPLSALGHLGSSDCVSPGSFTTSVSGRLTIPVPMNANFNMDHGPSNLQGYATQPVCNRQPIYSSASLSAPATAR